MVAGTSSSDTGLVFEPGTITVFVGPNNAGKSEALRELERSLCDEQEHSKRRPRVIGRAVLELPAKQDREAALRAIGAFNIFKEQFAVPFARPGASMTMGAVSQLDQDMTARQAFANAFTLRLDGTSRLQLLVSGGTGDLLRAPTSHLMGLFQNGEARRELRAMAFEAFGRYFVIDATAMDSFRARLSDREPLDEDEEQGLTSRARKFHSEAKLLAEFSDGVRCYISAIGAILNPQVKILLIDEPEAFLHPPLARRLGFHLARLANKRQSQVVTATHSSDFLLGLLESGATVNAVRLTYSGVGATARLLPTGALSSFTREPLLRSSSVLDALFHEHIIITEGDADRAFYEEINRRLLETVAADGAASCLFLNAQGKDAIPKLLGPLRSFGLRAAAIADIDVLLDGGTNWIKQLDAAGVPEVTCAGWSTMRSKLAEGVRSYGADTQEPRKVFKREGLNLLSNELKDAACDLIEGLSKYGYFVVDVGELEGWLRSEGVTGHGPSWLIPMFDRMGFDSSDPSYLRPKAGDVWGFIRRIAAWLRNGSP